MKRLKDGDTENNFFLTEKYYDQAVPKIISEARCHFLPVKIYSTPYWIQHISALWQFG
jgi:hypothetical protein